MIRSFCTVPCSEGGPRLLVKLGTHRGGPHAPAGVRREEVAVNSPIRIYRSAAVKAMTGEHASASGWWTPASGSSQRYVHQGELLPPADGSPALWVLVHEGHPSSASNSVVGQR
jgi:hypothetical protein